MTAIQALQRAPWSLRSYTGLIAAMATLTALAEGSSEGWVRVFWTTVFGIGACEGSRTMWCLCVLANVLFLTLDPFPFGDRWLSIPFSLICMALLLVPESRRYVFERGREPSQGFGRLFR